MFSFSSFFHTSCWTRRRNVHATLLYDELWGYQCPFRSILLGECRVNGFFHKLVKYGIVMWWEKSIFSPSTVNKNSSIKVNNQLTNLQCNQENCQLFVVTCFPSNFQLVKGTVTNYLQILTTRNPWTEEKQDVHSNQVSPNPPTAKIKRKDLLFISCSFTTTSRL